MREREFARRRRLAAVLECEVSEQGSAETLFVNRAPPLHTIHPHIHKHLINTLNTYSSKSPYEHLITSSPYPDIHRTPQLHHQNHYNTGGRLAKRRCRNHWFRTDAWIHKHFLKPQQPQCQYTTTRTYTPQIRRPTATRSHRHTWPQSAMIYTNN